MPQCVVPGCKSKSGSKEYILFRFPLCSETQQKWLQAVGRDDIYNPRESRVCNKHFQPSAFERHLKSELLQLPLDPRQIRFKPGAVPTLHLPHKKGQPVTTTTSGTMESSTELKVDLNDEGVVNVKSEPTDSQAPASHLPCSQAGQHSISSAEAGSHLLLASTQQDLKVEVKEEPLDSQPCASSPASTSQHTTSPGSPSSRTEYCWVNDGLTVPTPDTIVPTTEPAATTDATATSCMKQNGTGGGTPPAPLNFMTSLILNVIGMDTGTVAGVKADNKRVLDSGSVRVPAVEASTSEAAPEPSRSLAKPRGNTLPGGSSKPNVSESDSECHTEMSEGDTDSLTETDEYVSSADKLETFVEEEGEDDELYPQISASTDAEETEPGCPSGSESAADAFGRVKKRKTMATCATSSQPQSGPSVLPSPITSTLVPTSASCLVDESEEADVEEVGDGAQSEPGRGAKRRLHLPPMPDPDHSSSGEDEPPPRISFPPQRRHKPGSSRRISRRGRARAPTVVRSAGPSHSCFATRAASLDTGTSQPVDPMPGPIVVDKDWTWDNTGAFQPRQYLFTPAHRPGTTLRYADGEEKNRMNVFTKLFTEDLASQVCRTTNSYNFYRQAGKVEHPQSLYRNFSPVTPAELYVFLAVVMVMGSVKKNALHHYWSTDPLVATPGFSRIMGCKRFKAILGNLHFIDSLASHTHNQDRPREEKDPIERIRPIYSYLRTKMREAFHPYQKLLIDESSCLWRGNISMRQCIPSKRHRYGLKTFVLCDCRSGYIQDVMLYVDGKTELSPSPPSVDLAGAVVCTMMKDYVNKGHILYTNSWYTSPALSKHLDALATGSCGTVRRNQQHLPRLPSRREPNSIIYKQANGILLLSWMDNKEVNALSTVHTPVQEEAPHRRRGTGLPVKKPQCINDYNLTTGLVDKKDQVVASAECARKTMRWDKQFFFHLLDLALYNSHIIFRELTQTQETREEFCVELAREIIIRFKAQPISWTSFAKTQDPPLPRLNQRHFAEYLPPIGTNPNPRRRCQVCAHSQVRKRRRKDTRHYCPECNVGLCLVPCFKEYHTMEKY